jgi:tRNA A-37 threonylcarbamoyl transferase component Bud32
MPIEDVASRFPELEILSLLGSGAMGCVYKVRQPRLDRLVALKVLAHDPEDFGFVERFTREARTLARMDHPNIVTLYDFGEREGLFYFLMELVDGVTLRDLLSEERLEPEQTLQIIPPICAALQFAHEKGVVHRDIKPENILIDKNGRVKVADFGIARLAGAAPAENLTAQGQVLGTAHYMAPEQVEQPGSVDHRADIYALGVVFYEMLTGELPLGRFPAPSEKAGVDARLDEVVLRALEKDPERRYQQASDVPTAMDRIAAATVQMAAAAEAIHEAVSATGSPPPRRSWQLVAVVALCVVWATLAVVVLVRIMPGDEAMHAEPAPVEEPTEATAEMIAEPLSPALLVTFEGDPPPAVTYEVSASRGVESFTFQPVSAPSGSPFVADLREAEDGDYLIWARAPGYAAQWHSIKVKDGAYQFTRLVPQEEERFVIQLWKLRYLVLSYYVTYRSEPDFDGFDVEFHRVAASHWGRLPVLSGDFGAWQGEPEGNRFGANPFLSRHRWLGPGDPRGPWGHIVIGQREQFETIRKFETPEPSENWRMTHIPGTADRAYLLRIHGNHPGDHCYVKLLVEGIYDEPPEGIKVYRDPKQQF